MGKLDRCTRALENPVEKKERHIHHFRWPLAGAVEVSLLLVLAVFGLYVNHQKLQQYIANDTKYRSLKLIKNKSLEALLYAHDSTYLANPDMRKQVLEQEAARDRKLELLREAGESARRRRNWRRRRVRQDDKLDFVGRQVHDKLIAYPPPMPICLRGVKCRE